MLKQNTIDSLVRNEVIRVILLIPLVVAIIWLAVLAPGSGSSGFPSPYIQLSMVKGIILFAVVYSIGAVFFYRHIK